MTTEYVNISWEDRTARVAKAEFRIEDSEAYPGRLALGVYGRNTGDELGTAHVQREAATEVRRAITRWLGENPHPAISVIDVARQTGAADALRGVLDELGRGVSPSVVVAVVAEGMGVEL